MNIVQFEHTIAEYALAGEPFFFVVDFKMQRPFVCTLDEAGQYGFYFDIRGISNTKQSENSAHVDLEITPIDREIFSNAFALVMDNIRNGNTYLLNLTFPSMIRTDHDLEHIFASAKAPYKLYHEDTFITFSPECFIKTKGDSIYSYPMKGTIDANLPDARKTLLENSKELWEHHTIVDLIRNDLSMIANHVTVTKFRQVEKIKTARHELFQTSSEIRGELPADWKTHFGSMLLKLLPAGSISGAPKKKTVEIIEQVESVPRDYYTGVFGIFDGENIDSAVCIRFIEKKGSRLYYKSGGGITFMSNMHEEYQELIDKIYVPVI